jgi:hypothetical protein
MTTTRTREAPVNMAMRRARRLRFRSGGFLARLAAERTTVRHRSGSVQEVLLGGAVGIGIVLNGLMEKGKKS